MVWWGSWKLGGLKLQKSHICPFFSLDHFDKWKFHITKSFQQQKYWIVQPQTCFQTERLVTKALKQLEGTTAGVTLFGGIGGRRGRGAKLPLLAYLLASQAKSWGILVCISAFHQLWQVATNLLFAVVGEIEDNCAEVWQSTMSSLRERESAMPRIILPSSWKVDNTTWVKRGWAMMLSIVRIFTCQCNDYISLICTNANISFHTQILKNKPCICKSFSGVKLVVSS